MAVTLRSRKISGGRLSWSADIQPTPIVDGKPKRFWTLDIYTIECPKGAAEKAHNAALMERAKQKCAVLHLSSIDGTLPSRHSGMTVSESMREIGDGFSKSNTAQGWQTARTHCERFGIGGVLLCDLTPAQCVGFRGYLLRCMTPNSASTVLAKFRSMLRQAKRTGAIPIDLRDAFSPIPSTAVAVGWLEQSDMDRLFSTWTDSRCREPFIFACLVGLRHVDLTALRWKDVIDKPGGASELRYKVTKTSKVVTLPIGEQARSVLGRRHDDKCAVFPEIPKLTGYNAALKRWATRAGVDMPAISSHKARHTAAVLALDGGVPLEIVRDMLAHSSVSQTEVYAKVRAERVKQYAGTVKTSVDVSAMPKLRRVK